MCAKCFSPSYHIDTRAQSRTLPQESRDVLTYYKSEMEELSSCLRALYWEWQEYLERQERVSESTCYQVSVETSNSRRGRPRFRIVRDQLEYLQSLSFTWTDIAALLGVSRMTLFCRRFEFQMLTEPSRIVDDSQLRTILTTDYHEHMYNFFKKGLPPPKFVLRASSRGRHR